MHEPTFAGPGMIFAVLFNFAFSFAESILICFECRLFALRMLILVPFQKKMHHTCLHELRPDCFVWLILVALGINPTS